MLLSIINFDHYFEFVPDVKWEPHGRDLSPFFSIPSHNMTNMTYTISNRTSKISAKNAVTPDVASAISNPSAQTPPKATAAVIVPTYEGEQQQKGQQRQQQEDVQTVPPTKSQQDRLKSIARGGVAIPFPYRLHVMLDHMDALCSRGNTLGKAIVGWQPHGRAFKVHDARRFMEDVMPLFFNQTKYASFQRQLNLYGFLRITTPGPDKGAVYHFSFIRHQKHLVVDGMPRQKIKGTGCRKALPMEDQPNFYANEHLRAIAAVDKAFEQQSIPSETVYEPTKPVSQTKVVKPFVLHHYQYRR